ncbi:hypothetical protein [Streptomyces sp. B6B3]|uniref:hypothetical protein n=1 Tax=Streptomyces sp. B6B3 TaxID=3153570 RepID=UPI00325EA0BD
MRRPRGMTAARGALGLVGCGLLVWGGWLLLGETDADSLRGVAYWLLAALLAHDLLLAPLVLLLGLALGRTGGARRALRAGLLAAGCVTLVALPPLLRPGTPRNPTELPLDYPRNLLGILLAVALATAVALAVAVARRSRRTPDPRDP